MPASMSPRTPASPPTMGMSYNAPVAYNATLTYQQAGTVGSVKPRAVSAAAASSRTPAIATMRSR